jgi:hypothetical protein
VKLATVLLLVLASAPAHAEPTLGGPMSHLLVAVFGQTVYLSLESPDMGTVVMQDGAGFGGMAAGPRPTGAEQGQAQQPSHHRQHQHRVAHVNQKPERHGRNGAAKRQAGGDKAKHLADLPRRAGILQHHIARGARCAHGEAGKQANARQRDLRQRHQPKHQEHRHGEKGQDGDKAHEPSGLGVVNEPAADQRAAGGADHIAGQHHRSCRDRSGSPPTSPGLRW